MVYNGVVALFRFICDLKEPKVAFALHDLIDVTRLNLIALNHANPTFNVCLNIPIMLYAIVEIAVRHFTLSDLFVCFFFASIPRFKPSKWKFLFLIYHHKLLAPMLASCSLSARHIQIAIAQFNLNLNTYTLVLHLHSSDTQISMQVASHFESYLSENITAPLYMMCIQTLFN